MKIYDCRVNHLKEPLGYSLGEPVFSWKVNDAAGNWAREPLRRNVFCKTHKK